MNDESGQSMEPTEEVPLIRQYIGWAKKAGPQTHDHNSLKS